MIALPVFLCSAPAAARAPELHYRIRPVPTTDRTTFSIRLSFDLAHGDSIVVTLPTDYYGTRDLHRFVVDFAGVDGTRVSAGGSAQQRVVHPGDNGRVVLHYVISYDPVELASAAFGPHVGPAHFHLAGCQYLLQIGNDRNARFRTIIDVHDAPQGWHFYSSLTPHALHVDTVASYRELISPVLGGSAKRPAHFEVREQSIQLWIGAGLIVPDSAIRRAVERIVRSQREWLDDHGQTFYHVVILPRRGVLAGTSIPNLFVCFARPGATLEELVVLIAHETLHAWLPNRIEVQHDSTESPSRYEWLHEGVVDYLGRRILRHAGLLSQTQFVERLNRDLIDLATNPFRDLTHAELAAAVAAGRYSGLHRRLAYDRGALIAFDWDTRMQRNGHDFGELLRALLRVARVNGGTVSETAFNAAGERVGVAPLMTVERSILRGERIDLPDPLPSGLEVRDSVVRIWTPGFSLLESNRTGVVTGVRAGSPPYQAGLRNGMEFLRLQSWQRYSPHPLVVLVRAGGVERRFEYPPEPGNIRLRILAARK